MMRSKGTEGTGVDFFFSVIPSSITKQFDSGTFHFSVPLVDYNFEESENRGLPVIPWEQPPGRDLTARGLEPTPTQIAAEILIIFGRSSKLRYARFDII
jgi:hypothetical protein